MPDGVSTPSGSEFELGADDGGDEDDRCPNVVPEVRNSKKRTKAKPTREAITQARHDFDYPATPAGGGKRAREALSEEQSAPV